MENKKGGVFYTTSNAIPNSGCVGFGYHGYIYNSEESKKNQLVGIKDWFPTKDKYSFFEKIKPINNPEVLKEETEDVDVPLTEPTRVSLDLYVDGFGSLDAASTVNGGGATAILTLLQSIEVLDLKDVTVHIDNKFVFNAITKWINDWRSNGYKTTNGSEVPNQDVWKRIDEINTRLQSGINIKYCWIKRASGDLGNDKAVYNCSLGLIRVSNGNYNKYTETISNIKDYWKPKVDINPMVMYNNNYFNTASKNIMEIGGVNHYTYYCGTHGKDDDFIGKPITDNVFSVLFLKEPLEVLEIVKSRQAEIETNGDALLVVAKLPAINNPIINNEIMKHGGEFLHTNSRKLDLYSSTETLVTKVLQPPRMAASLSELLGNYYKILKNHVTKKDGNVTLTDITDSIYDRTGKKVKLLSNITNALTNLPIIFKDHLGKDNNLHLSIGYDLPNRNALNKLCDCSPKVSIVQWKESSVGYRYAVIIETALGVGIYGAFYANLKLDI